MGSGIDEKPMAVLMVTGAYAPEGSGASFQCRELIRALKGRARFAVLTTSANTQRVLEEEVEGIPVIRIPLQPGRRFSKVKAAFHFFREFLRLRHRFEILHLHGFSQKSVLLVFLAKLLGKRVVLKITSAGQDDPLSVRERNPFFYRFYTQADLFLGVSPGVQERYEAAGLPSERFLLIPNGVDGARFRPAEPEERLALRRQLGLPSDLLLLLFVGFFSREKQPDLLFQAWERLQGNGLPPTGVLFVGATRPTYLEVDPHLAQEIRTQARRMGLEKHLFFVETTQEIERYYQAADIFVLPSRREGLPNALLEAMASGLACIASRLPGATDVIIDHAVNGLLVSPGERSPLEAELRGLIRDTSRIRALGKAARETILKRYPISRTAHQTWEAYRQVIRWNSGKN